MALISLGKCGRKLQSKGNPIMLAPSMTQPNVYEKIFWNFSAFSFHSWVTNDTITRVGKIQSSKSLTSHFLMPLWSISANHYITLDLFLIFWDHLLCKCTTDTILFNAQPIQWSSMQQSLYIMPTKFHKMQSALSSPALQISSPCSLAVPF